MIVLSLYEPAVACFGQQFGMRDAVQTWQNLLTMIPVSTERQTFGPEGESGVQVEVPVTYSLPPDPRESSPVDSFRHLHTFAFAKDSCVADVT